MVKLRYSIENRYLNTEEERMEVDLEQIQIRRGTTTDLSIVAMLNREIFNEDRLINSLDHDYLMLLIAEYNGIAIGFKVGYRDESGSFYSAKGGILQAWRRKGIARLLLRRMMAEAKADGFHTFTYHTFPARWPGMLKLGKSEGFMIADVNWSHVYSDYQVLMKIDLRTVTCNW
jgi:GNAT superfamily N-acetyltransferase